MRFPFSCVLWLALSVPAAADSNIAPGRNSSWSANLGWWNWRPVPDDGVVVGEDVCAGSIYAANAGWIHLGDGLPADGLQYRNDSASDYGVNLDAAGNLRGFAYGANVGWIHFESTGAPKLDRSTGAFSGFAYGANIGWIDLGSAGSDLAIHTGAIQGDADADGVPDEWELLHTGALTDLGGATDYDRDGQTDRQEYGADTDPTDPADRLQLLGLALAPDGASWFLTWTSKPTRQYWIEARANLGPESSWTDAGPGLQSADGTVTTKTVPADSAQRFFRIRAVAPPIGQ